MTHTSPTSLAITGGYVVPIDGAPIDGGTVLIEEGRITAVGTDLALPADAEVIDATGQWVLPGFVDAHAHLGVHEEGIGPAGGDVNEMTGTNMAAVRAIDAINIDEEGFRDALKGGVTSAVIKPGSGNPIGGQTAAIKTWGGRTVDEQIIKDTVSIKSALGENPKRVYGERKQTPSTRLGIAKVIREAFVAAANYAAKRDHAEEEGKPFERDLTKETLARVLAGELYWDQHTHRHDDIATAIRLAEEFGYKLVVNHGTEGHKIADVLAEKNIPVIYGPMITSRSKVELKDRAMESLAAMAKAGVKVAITTDAPVVPIDFLVHQASFAVKAGLDRETALRALTINPAEILGLDDRVGALRPGLDGDVVVWSGDPLDVYSHVEHTVIGGVPVYSRSGGVVERPTRFAG
ncbi:amidohydrolase [Bogoriella caseilytica]|uniref:Imidazolonepropionase-like amidohydrolase n=1 Tax=Bogoriella caseilytica TaxID=56055 RepID=A0A3N2BG64_9MICO|nr:amidohydrolase [Bogoriella caseilytica]ROR74054.1 imidazolonepropionase-like amidohydrolase [Bogoriella caseilytica]